MIGYEFTATCPVCGDELAHQAAGRAHRTTANAVAHCTRCRRDWLIAVQLTAVKGVIPHRGRKRIIVRNGVEHRGTSRKRRSRGNSAAIHTHSGEMDDMTVDEHSLLHLLAGARQRLDTRDHERMRKAG